MAITMEDLCRKVAYHIETYINPSTESNTVPPLDSTLHPDEKISLSTKRIMVLFVFLIFIMLCVLVYKLRSTIVSVWQWVTRPFWWCVEWIRLLSNMFFMTEPVL